MQEHVSPNSNGRHLQKYAIFRCHDHFKTLYEKTVAALNIGKSRKQDMLFSLFFCRSVDQSKNQVYEPGVKKFRQQDNKVRLYFYMLDLIVELEF